MEKYLEKELIKWENGLYERNMKRMYKTKKNYKDPRKKALEDYLHHRNTKWIYSHECRYIKKLTNRKLRRKLRKELYNEAYYKVIPHDYKTYGWSTW